MQKRFAKTVKKLVPILFLIFIIFSMTGCLSVLGYILSGDNSGNSNYEADEDERPRSKPPSRTDGDGGSSGSAPGRSM